MPKTHRGQSVGDNHSNVIKWDTPQDWGVGGSTPGTPSSTHKGAEDYYEANIYSEDGAHHVQAVHSTPYWRCEDGSCRDESSLIADNMELSYRTPKRAMMAAQALVNRHAAGNTQPYSNGLRRRQVDTEDY